METMGLRTRPSDLASLQSLAAIGQTVLMQTFSELFRKFDSHCAQVLLTWDDFDDRQRYNNARNTLKTILSHRVVPVINENDTISTEEIKFGDNDKLSAFVATLVHADLLLILSDVEGFYTLKPGEAGGKPASIFEEIKEITPEIEGLAGGTTKSQLSKGGMLTKLEAVKMAAHAKIPAIIAHAETKKILSRILQGERIGTFFVERENKLLDRQHWISFGAKPKGVVFVDEGAQRALLQGGKSLLLPGVVSWEGHFKRNDVIVVCGPDRHEIARGLCGYSVGELQESRASEDRRGKREVIHCNNLVLCKR
jgi:glutamate 5-kinase